MPTLSSPKPIVALIYDFDGTLIAGNMQEYGFIERLTVSKEAFWSDVKAFAHKHRFDDHVLAYMYFMIKAARAGDLRIKKQDFQSLGQRIRFFVGVESWFDRLQKRWGKHLQLQHYIISSGIQEMIEGCAIAQHFKKIYACQFVYDDTYGYPIWPGRVINFSTKTQYLFRINKGTDNIQLLNKYTPEVERPVPFRNMLYFGDGDTDIPCMRLVKQGGGHVFALYDPADQSSKQKEEAQGLVRDGRAHMALAADYRSDTQLAKSVDLVLDMLRAELKWLHTHTSGQDST